MRLTDADRDRLLEWLGRCAAAGAIDSAEHERRAELVLRAPTREAAQPALADLPPLSGRDSPAIGRARPRARRGRCA